MNGINAYHNQLLAQHQRRLDERAELEQQMDKFKDLISQLLEENHPAELARLTGIDDPTCKKAVHQLYMERFNDPDLDLAMASRLRRSISLLIRVMLALSNAVSKCTKSTSRSSSKP